MVTLTDEFLLTDDVLGGPPNILATATLECSGYIPYSIILQALVTTDMKTLNVPLFVRRAWSTVSATLESKDPEFDERVYLSSSAMLQPQTAPGRSSNPLFTEEQRARGCKNDLRLLFHCPFRTPWRFFVSYYPNSFRSPLGSTLNLISEVFRER